MFTEHSQIAILGIDAGGTKTEGVALTPSGTVLARVLGGPGNYQATGLRIAQATVCEVVASLVAACRSAGQQPVAIGYGLSGLDRPKDRARLEDLTDAVAETVGEEALKFQKVLVNDTFLILRAGTDDGVGVAVVSGTGANTVGRSKDGREARVGGLAAELGDSGGGTDIAIAGLRAARRGKDGRGPKTLIEDLVVSRLGLSEIEDLVDFMIPNDDKTILPFHAVVASLAPLVFEAAKAGDSVAREILVGMGLELGLCARLVATQLFKPEDAFPLVFGGSVLTKACDPIFATTIAREVRKAFPRVEIRTLNSPPVLGGVLLAWDLLAEKGELDEALSKRRQDSAFRDYLGRAISAQTETSVQAATR